MKLKFSRITIGFTSAGFLFAALSAITSIMYGTVSPAFQPTLSEVASILFFFCPFSLAEMVLEHANSLTDYMFVYGFELISNTILYFLLGLFFSSAWRILNGPETKQQT